MRSALNRFLTIIRIDHPNVKNNFLTFLYFEERLPIFRDLFA